MKKELIKELKTLSPKEKLSITEMLWDSLKEDDVPLTESQKVIIREREEKYRTGNQKLFTWQEVKKDT